MKNCKGPRGQLPGVNVSKTTLVVPEFPPGTLSKTDNSFVSDKSLNLLMGPNWGIDCHIWQHLAASKSIENRKLIIGL